MRRRVGRLFTMQQDDKNGELQMSPESSAGVGENGTPSRGTVFISGAAGYQRCEGVTLAYSKIARSVLNTKK